MPEAITITCPHCDSPRLAIDTLGNLNQDFLFLNLDCMDCGGHTVLQLQADGSTTTVKLLPMVPPPTPEPPTPQQLLAQAMALLQQQADVAPLELTPAAQLPVVLTDEAPAPVADGWQQQWGEPLRWWKYTSGFTVPCEVCGGPCDKGSQVRYLPADRSPSGTGQTMHRACWAQASGLDVDR